MTAAPLQLPVSQKPPDAPHHPRTTFAGSQCLAGPHEQAQCPEQPKNVRAACALSASAAAASAEQAASASTVPSAASAGQSYQCTELQAGAGTHRPSLPQPAQLSSTHMHLAPHTQPRQPIQCSTACIQEQELEHMHTQSNHRTPPASTPGTIRRVIGTGLNKGSSSWPHNWAKPQCRTAHQHEGAHLRTPAICIPAGMLMVLILA